MKTKGLSTYGTPLIMLYKPNNNVRSSLNLFITNLSGLDLMVGQDWSGGSATCHWGLILGARHSFRASPMSTVISNPKLNDFMTLKTVYLVFLLWVLQ